MKKKIGIGVVLLAEIVFLILYGLYPSVGEPSWLKPIAVAGDYFSDTMLKTIASWLQLSEKNFGKIVAFIALNAAFIVVYYAVFCSIGAIVKASRKKKIARVVKCHYVPSEAEEDKFDYRRFMKRFPVRRLISLLIPLLFIAVFVLTRFDSAVSAKVHANVQGTWTIYSDHIEGMIVGVFSDDASVIDAYLKLFTNASGFGYIDLINRIPENFAWTEYVILPVLSVLILAIWYGFFSLLNLLFRKTRAKRKAKRAKNRYIFKKDYQEYKVRTKHAKEYSSKSEQFMYMVESDNEEIQKIAKVNPVDPFVRDDKKPADYYDDLGTGVRDLGVGQVEEEPLNKAITEREVRYISDKDFDIVLEEEPVIEVVEEDGIDQLKQQGREDELYYEKYQADEIRLKTVEEYTKDRYLINEYVSNIKGEPAEEKDEEAPLPPEKKEEEKTAPVAEEKPAEEKKAEESKDEFSGLTPLERYRLQKKREKERLEAEQRALEAERQAMIDNGTLTEENDPFRNFRKPGARSGKVEARVPTHREQEAERQARLKKQREARAARKAEREKAALQKKNATKK